MKHIIIFLAILALPNTGFSKEELSKVSATSAGFGDACHILEDNYVKCGTFYGFVERSTPIKKLKVSVIDQSIGKTIGKTRVITLDEKHIGKHTMLGKYTMQQAINDSKDDARRSSILSEALKKQHPDIFDNKNVLVRLGSSEGIGLPEDTVLYHDSNLRKKMAKVGDLKKVKGKQECQYIQQTVAEIPDVMCGNKKIPVKVCMGRARCGVTFPLTIARQRGDRGGESQTNFYTEHVACKTTKNGKCPSATKCASSPVSLTTKYNNKMLDRKLPGVPPPVGYGTPFGYGAPRILHPFGYITPGYGYPDPSGEEESSGSVK